METWYLESMVCSLQVICASTYQMRRSLQTC